MVLSIDATELRDTVCTVHTGLQATWDTKSAWMLSKRQTQFCIVLQSARLSLFMYLNHSYLPLSGHLETYCQHNIIFLKIVTKLNKICYYK
jgi:hypothetical protein